MTIIGIIIDIDSQSIFPKNKGLNFEGNLDISTKMKFAQLKTVKYPNMYIIKMSLTKFPVALVLNKKEIKSKITSLCIPGNAVVPSK